MVVRAPVLVHGLLWCIHVHVHFGFKLGDLGIKPPIKLIGGFMPRSPSRCLACSLVYVELGITRTLRMSL